MHGDLRLIDLRDLKDAHGSQWMTVNETMGDLNNDQAVNDSTEVKCLVPLTS